MTKWTIQYETQQNIIVFQGKCYKGLQWGRVHPLRVREVILNMPTAVAKQNDKPFWIPLELAQPMRLYKSLYLSLYERVWGQKTVINIYKTAVFLGFCLVAP
jgi:hypothetical protein